MAGDHVVICGVGDDRAVIRRLAAALHQRGFAVVANDSAESEDLIGDFAHDAAAVVVASADPNPGSLGWWLPDDVGRVVPVRLTPSARIPDDLVMLEVIDLSGWTDDRRLDELAQRLTALVDDSRQRSFGPRPIVEHMSLADGEAAVSSPMYAVTELEALAEGVRDVGMLLAAADEDTSEVRATLDEIGKSYRVVLDSIDEFFASGSASDAIDAAAMARLRGGHLRERIRNGRGHCKRIGMRYFGYGGMRASLLGKVPDPTLAKADRLFRQLTNADLDLFESLDMVGGVLTKEARAIYTLVIARQSAAARQRFMNAHSVLEPLEAALDHALAKFQDIEESLGYAQDASTERPAVEDRSINIYGDVIGGVVAQAITNSRIALTHSTAPPVIRDDVERLLNAVAAMTQELSPGDAEAAAIEVEQLTTEIARPQPRVGVIQKCLRSLEQFGKSVAGVGIPVVELVAKIAAFF